MKICRQKFSHEQQKLFHGQQKLNICRQIFLHGRQKLNICSEKLNFCWQILIICLRFDLNSANR
jgi:hypothetical protein